MPRASHPCAEPGCPTLVGTGSYCTLHEATRRQRPEGSQTFYNSTFWKKLRAAIRRQQPVCAICQARPTKVIDHIDADFRNNDPSNLRGLCMGCEKSRTAKQHRAKVGR